MTNANFTLDKEVVDGLARLAQQNKQFNLGQFVNNALQMAIRMENTQFGKVAQMRSADQEFAAMVKRGGEVTIR